MGTNYYLMEKGDWECECCGQKVQERERHIGKSSYGWCFGLHVYPDEGINTLDDWVAYWSKGRIVDEYGAFVSHEEMLQVIAERQHPQTIAQSIMEGSTLWRSEEEFHRVNHSQPGPNNLLRHRIESGHCIGHGEGTYDYIVGDFS